MFKATKQVQQNPAQQEAAMTTTMIPSRSIVWDPLSRWLFKIVSIFLDVSDV